MFKYLNSLRTVYAFTDRIKSRKKVDLFNIVAQQPRSLTRLVVSSRSSLLEQVPFGLHVLTLCTLRPRSQFAVNTGDFDSDINILNKNKTPKSWRSCAF